MSIREIRELIGDTQSEFALRYNIPLRTIQNWETGTRKPAKYILDFLKQATKRNLINKKTFVIPKYDETKKNLPKKSDYIGNIAWLKAIQECLGENIVFALDQALMCQENFLGRTNEDYIWIYGSNKTKQFNGILLLGNHINPKDVVSKNGLNYTTFERTIYDSFSNEEILDMQGITEALSNYYYKNNESFSDLHISPEFSKEFEALAIEAIEYYDYQ